MEEETKQLPFPIKTKIAAWLLIFQAFSPFLYSLFLKLCIGCQDRGWGPMLRNIPVLEKIFNIIQTFIFSVSGWGGEFSPFFTIIYSLLAITSGIFLLRRKRWAWWIYVVLMPLYNITIFGFLFYACAFGGCTVARLFFIFFLGTYFSLLIFILLLIDCKNFFKITS